MRHTRCVKTYMIEKHLYHKENFLKLSSKVNWIRFRLCIFSHCNVLSILKFCVSLISCITYLLDFPSFLSEYVKEQKDL